METTKTEIELYVIEKVKELRNAANLSQKDLSIDLNLSSGFVGHVESFKSDEKYNFNHINELARYFNVPFAYFFPTTHLETNCIEQYMDLHPRVRAKYEK